MDVTQVQIQQSSDNHYAETITVERLVDDEWTFVHTATAQEVQTLETIYPAPIFAWRISATTTRSGWAWDVQRLKFLTPAGEIQLGDNGCQAIDSESLADHGAQFAGYAPESAFNDGGGLQEGCKWV